MRSVILFLTIECILISNILVNSPIQINMWCPIGGALGFIGAFYMKYRKESNKS